MTPPTPMAVGGLLPDFENWGFDKITGWVEETLGGFISEAFRWLAELALSSAIYMSNMVWNLAAQGSEVELAQAQGENYQMTLALAAMFLVALLWAGIGLAALKGDAGLMMTRVFKDAPMAVLGATSMLAILDAVVKASNEIDQWIIARSGSGEGPFSAYEELLNVEGGVEVAISVPVMLISYVMILVALAIVLFLMIRFAALNLLVVFVPLAMIAKVTPYSSMARLVLEKFLALVFAKTVILVALSVAGGLMSNVPLEGQIHFESPAPASPSEDVEQVDQELFQHEFTQPDANGARILGTLIAGLGVLIIAGFSPAVIYQLIPSAYHDTSPYSGSDVAGTLSSAGPGGTAFSSARRTAARVRPRRRKN